MLSLHGLPLAVQIGLPLLALCWVAMSRHRSIGQWLLEVAVLVVIMLAAHLGGLWTVLPWYTTFGFAVLLAITAFRQRDALRDLPWWSAAGGRAIAVRLVVAVAAVVLFSVVLMGRRPPGPAVDLHFPLEGGTYLAVNAGSNRLVNAHLVTLTGERYRPFRGQSYGVDLVRLNALGLRASGLLPAALDEYAIYGDLVRAPCSGSVVQLATDAPDMIPPWPDRSRMAGNHVLLECDGVHVLLAHFKPGTIRVEQGERVKTGTLLGVVGNSGNSNEPHLHIHAQRPAASADPLSGDPLPITFRGRYLARNDRFSSTTMAWP